MNEKQRNKIKEVQNLLAGVEPEAPIKVFVVDADGNDKRTGLPPDLPPDDRSNRIIIVKVKRNENTTREN